MARMILTYEVRPEDGEVEFSQLQEVTEKMIKDYDDSVSITTLSEKEMGFGLKAVEVNFSLDENCGSENLEEQLKKTEEIGDVIVLSMSRAMG